MNEVTIVLAGYEVWAIVLELLLTGMLCGMVIVLLVKFDLKLKKNRR